MQREGDESAQTGDAGVYFVVAGAALCLFMAGFWWCCRVVIDGANLRKQQEREVMMALYAARRDHLLNMKLFRGLQLFGNLMYVGVISWVYLVQNLNSLTSARVFGLMFAYFMVAANCWSLTVTLVPYFEPVMLDYNSIVTAAMHIVYVSYVHISSYTGLSNCRSFYDKVVVADLVWLLADVPLEAYLPVHFVGVAIDFLVHVDKQRFLLSELWSLIGVVALYLFLGLALPILTRQLLSCSSTPIKIPAPFFHIASFAIVVYLELDMLLRIPKVAKPLQESAQQSAFVQTLNTILYASEHPVDFAYGIPTHIGVTFVSICLVLVILCSLVMALAEDSVSGRRPAVNPKSDYMKYLYAVVVGFLRSLPLGKKYVVCLTVCISGLQLLGVVSIISRLLLFGAASLGVTAPLILLSIMLGVVVEVFGVLYIVMPTPAQNRSYDCDSDSARSMRSTMSTTYRNTGHSPTRPDVPDSTDASALFSVAGVSVSSGSLYQDSRFLEGDSSDFRSRIEALANFKTFMQGLDSQPGVYTLEDFMKGAANAMKGIFPSVHHASFCLLNSGRVSVNMYTFIGEGSNKPPRMNVAIAPGTLIFYVLNKCQPVFISNIVTFPGPYSDVQFMRFVLGLKSVACLPLVVGGSRLLGVLRLGFEKAWQWEEQEKGLAKQLALVLSSSSQSIKSQPVENEESFDYNGPPSTAVSGSYGAELFEIPKTIYQAGPIASDTIDRQVNFPAGAGQALSQHDSGAVRPVAGNNFDGAQSPGSSIGGRDSQRWDAEPVAGGRAGKDLVMHSSKQDIKMLEIIGRGGFGSVYKAFWRGQIVAVKVLEHGDDFVGCAETSNKPDNLDTTGRRAALLEGAMTSTINHPNVVQTFDYRVVHLNPGPVSHGLSHNRVLQETHIIMEFCDRGSLQDAIEQGAFLADGPNGARIPGQEPEVDMEAILMTLVEVSAAMDYLHGHRMTHRDLKPKNILLKSSPKDRRGFTAKVSDFGLSQVLPDTSKTHLSTKYSGTVTHMPPELIEDGKVYQTGDVYAFGIIMWEVYTGNTPYANMAHPQIMVGVVTHNLRPKYPESCPEWYRSLSYRCWKKDAKGRPSFTEINHMLEQLLSNRSWG